MTDVKRLSTTQLAKQRGMLPNDQKYLARKQEKQAIYQKYNFNLIELTDEEVLNLDDVLPRMLLKFGVQAY